MYTYGEKLKEIRKYLRFSQEEMAHKLCLAPRAYAAYERNENKPPLSMLDMLHLNFNVNLNWFISERGGMILPDKNPYENTPADKTEIIKIVEEYLEQRIKKNNELNR